MITTQNSSPYFLINLRQSKSKAYIKMTLLTESVNTKDLPATYTFLKKSLPSILHSTCYNNENLPFFEEVKCTEIGHLYEHILLEYLCKLKLKKGHNRATYKGKTHWNWVRDPKGTFHIVTSAKIEDADILEDAIQQSSELLHLLLSHKKKGSYKSYKQTQRSAYMMVG